MAVNHAIGAGGARGTSGGGGRRRRRNRRTKESGKKSKITKEITQNMSGAPQSDTHSDVAEKPKVPMTRWVAVALAARVQRSGQVSVNRFMGLKTTGIPMLCA